MGVSQNTINMVLDRFNKRKLLGQILLDLKVLSQKELDGVLEKQKKLQETMGRQPLGDLLVKMAYTTYESYMEALSKHFNMPIISLTDFGPQPSLQKAVGEKYAEKNKIVVLENGPDQDFLDQNIFKIFS
jgi:hypothetical protein